MHILIQYTGGRTKLIQLIKEVRGVAKEGLAKGGGTAKGGGKKKWSSEKIGVANDLCHPHKYATGLSLPFKNCSEIWRRIRQVGKVESEQSFRFYNFSFLFFRDEVTYPT